MIDEGREEVKRVKELREVEEFKEVEDFRRVNVAETFPREAA